MFAEFLANDKPLLIRHEGAVYLPVFNAYAETEFGGDFATEADYRDPYVIELIEGKGGRILWPPLRYSYDTINLDLDRPAPAPPSAENWLGTDDQGRDVLARLIYGFRISVLFGLALTVASSLIGVAAGAVQGYFGGWTDLTMQRFIEIWTSVPSLYLLIIIAAVIEPGFWILLGILLLFSWVALVGVVRAEFLRARNFEYVEAARALGVANLTIMRRHLLPNAMVATLTFHAVHPQRLHHHADLAGFPRLRPAARLAVARRAAGAGQSQSAGAVARPVRLFHHCRHAVAAHLHRRSGARCVRPQKDAAMSALVSVKNLSVGFANDGRVTQAVKGVSFDIMPGETLGLVGESGSGKSVSALSVLKLLPYPAAFHDSGEILFGGQDLMQLDEAALRAVRGASISMIFQEPMSSLNPLHAIEKQIAEIVELHQGVSREAARAEALRLLKRVGIPDAENRLSALPHELSGGQRQRVMIAMALANKPKLLIADEPTTALDVTVQKQILDLLQELQAETGMAVLLHDLGVVRKMADRICVMQHGEIDPQHPYTQRLMAAERAACGRRDAGQSRPAARLGVGIVGESGTLGRAPLGLQHGEIVEAARGKAEGAATGCAVRRHGHSRSGAGCRKPKARRVRDTIAAAAQTAHADRVPRPVWRAQPAHGGRRDCRRRAALHAPQLDRTAIEAKVRAILQEVELDPDTAHRYPHEFSGGQRQRIAIARALILQPEFMVLDEPTSALDRSVQAQIIDLLRRLQAEKGLAYLFISHDLKVVRALSHRVMVMQNGLCVEEGTADEIFERPQQPYTQALLSAALDS